MSNAAIVERYYAAFNRRDREGMLALLAEDIVHEPSQGAAKAGKAAFRDFLAYMDARYEETVFDLVVMESAAGSRVAAEFELTGRYLRTDGLLPAAMGQAYRLRVGAFFEVRGNLIRRVSNHYNLNDWIEQVAAV